MKISFRTRPECPYCRGTKVKKSRRRNTPERLAAIAFVRTYRCTQCDNRFWGSIFWGDASGTKRNSSLALSRFFSVRCPFCGTEGVRRSRKHHFRDTLLGWIGISPCRCHDCNTSFYRLSTRLPK